ncbi:MAG TPA: ABC transporter permease [Anaerolineae bacterium]
MIDNPSADPDQKPRLALAAEGARPSPTAPRWASFGNWLQKQTIFILVLVLIAASALVSDVFLTPRNIINVIRVASIAGLVTFGEALVLLGGRFDLSVGTTLAAAGSAFLLLEPQGLVVATAGALLTGIVIGSINGLFVAVLDANALIVTLGMSSAVMGLLLIVTKAAFLTGHDPAFTFFGRADVAGIPVPVIIFLLSLVLLELLLRKTPFGRSIYAMGHNQEGAFASGIPVIRIRFLSYVLCGMMAALGGIVLTARLNSAEAVAGVGYEFDAITACILGGISLAGGEGSMVRASVGVLTLTILSNLLVLLNAPFTSQLMVKGSVFVFMVALDSIIKQRGRRQ